MTAGAARRCNRQFGDHALIDVSMGGGIARPDLGVGDDITAALVPARASVTSASSGGSEYVDIAFERLEPAPRRRCGNGWEEGYGTYLPIGSVVVSVQPRIRLWLHRLHHTACRVLDRALRYRHRQLLTGSGAGPSVHTTQPLQNDQANVDTTSRLHMTSFSSETKSLLRTAAIASCAQRNLHRSKAFNGDERKSTSGWFGDERPWTLNGEPMYQCRSCGGFNQHADIQASSRLFIGIRRP